MSYGSEEREELAIARGIAEDNAYQAVKAGIWRMRDGTEINLMDMSSRHINNCIRMLKDKDSELSELWVKRFEKELAFRDYVKRVVIGDLE